MANPTPAAIAAIRGHVADWAPTDAEIAAALNTATEPNPVPQGTVPRYLLTADVLGLLSPASVGALFDSGNLPDMRDTIVAQDREGVVTWAAAALLAGKINQAEHDAVAAMAQETVPDPAWQAEVSWAVLTLGRAVDAADIAAARAAGGE